MLLPAGCIDENITRVSENIEITSSYSIPGGPLTYNINDYLDTLQAIHVPWPNFLYYNDIIYPNYLSHLTRDDVKQFDFSQLSDRLDIVESVMFRLIIINDYPTAAVAQVYFADAAFVYLDSVFADGPHQVLPAPVNSDGIAEASFEEIVDVYMTPAFVSNMANIRYIVIESIIYTTRSDIPIVRFYTDNAFHVNVAARIQLRFNTGDQ